MFTDSIKYDQFTITEAKHGSDLRKLMDWAVDKEKKHLRVKFKSGMGDFGGGNNVTVVMDGSVFSTKPLQKYIFTISTDVL